MKVNTSYFRSRHPRILLRTLPLLSLLSLTSCGLASFQLCALLFGGDARYNILEWVLDDAHCPNLGWIKWFALAVKLYGVSI